MKKLILTFLIVMLSLSTEELEVSNLNNKRVEIVEAIEEEVYEEYTVTATVYNPVKSQCSGNPLITASGNKIDIKKLESGQLKWIAVSRDFLESRKLKFGDTVIISSDNPRISGEYKVMDTMNKRHKKKVDILMPNSVVTGKWTVTLKIPQ